MPEDIAEMKTKIADLIQENDKLKNQVASADRNVTRHLNTIEQLNAKLESGGEDSKPDKKPDDDGAGNQERQYRERIELLDMRERALRLAKDLDIDPEKAFVLLTGDDEEKLRAYREYGDEREQTVRDEFLRLNGRGVEQVQLGGGDLTLEQISRLSAEQSAALPSEVVSRAIAAETAERMRGKTFRAQISRNFWGKR